MLENIKSSYILRLIVFNVKDEKKLNILKYNNNLKRRLKINLLNYQELSGKYIIYDTIDKGKIYNIYNNELLYEGE